MKLTISDAARLYGIHRSTIHRHMKAGRLSCVFQEDGSRALDLSELIRCYGEPPNSPAVMRQGATPSATPGATPDATGATGQQNNDNRTADLLAELLEVTRQQSRTLEQQREELAALRREVAELRTLPAPGALAPHDQLAPDQTPPRPASPPPQEQEAAPPVRAPGSVLSFGDLLERLEKRQQH